MKEFSLAGFASFAAGLAIEIGHHQHAALEKAAVIIEDAAKAAIGTYNYEWKPLAGSTLKKKSADTPLLESGKMRDSIHHSVQGDEARVGSNEDTAVWQELGHQPDPASILPDGIGDA
jgi:hypothetical protein